MKEIIKKLILKAVNNLFKGLSLKETDFEVSLIENESLGDYTSNISFLISKKTKESPTKIAEKLLLEISSFKETKIYFEKVEAINGFLNFYLSLNFLKKYLFEIERKKNVSFLKNKIKKTIVVDYSSPNIAKPFGIGHLRSTIVGQGILNLYKFLGWKTIGDNHLGDWGTQFGKLIYQIKNELLKNKTEAEKNKILKKITIDDLEKLYVSYHNLSKENPELDNEARKWFKKLEEKDKEAIKIWKTCVNISLKEFNRIYKMLKVKFDVVLGESFYENLVKDVFKELKEKNLIKESEGALIFDFNDKELPPIVVIKSDGATTYFLRDLATIKYRLKKWKPDLIVYEVGADQTLYFKQVFKAVEILGWAKKTSFFHINHGLIRWPWGKFSTRKGETIHLEEVLKEGIEKSLKILEKTQVKKHLSLKEKKKIAFKVGIGAIKYNILSYHYKSDIIFDWDKILNLEGNSGPYIQYTIVRCVSVLKKAKIKNIPKKFNYSNFNQEEQRILRELAKFETIILEAAEKYSLNLLCDYAFRLSSLFNLFYEKHQILKAENQEVRNFRLALTFKVKETLEKILNLLGIDTLEKM
jgi:arginyl-tRNA synthetase